MSNILGILVFFLIVLGILLVCDELQDIRRLLERIADKEKS